MTKHRLRALCLALLLCGPGSLMAQALRTALQANLPRAETLESPSLPALCVDLMRALEAQDPALRFVGTDRTLTQAQIEGGLKLGQLDIFCAMLRSPSREARFIFIDVPIAQVRQRLAVDVQDPIDVGSLEALRQLGAIVAVTQGSAQEEWLSLQGGVPLQRVRSLSSAHLRPQQDGAARLVFHSEAALQQHKLTQFTRRLQWRLLPWVVREEGLYLVASLHLAPGRAGRLRAALAALAERGELAQIALQHPD